MAPWAVDVTVMYVKNITMPSFRIPGGFFLTIDDDLKTSINVPTRDRTVVWNQTLKLACAPVEWSIKLRASLEFGDMLGNGYVIGEIKVKTSKVKPFQSVNAFNVFFPAVGDAIPVLTLNVSFRPVPKDANKDNAPPPLMIGESASNEPESNESEFKRTIAQDTDDGHAQLALYMAGHSLCFLQTALEYFKDALDKCSDNPGARAAALTNLAWASLTGFVAKDKYLEGVNMIIPYLREALTLRPLSHPDHAPSAYNLAYALSQFHQCEEAPVNLRESVSLYCAVLPRCRGTFFRTCLLDKRGLDDVIQKCNALPTCGSLNLNLPFRRMVVMLSRVGYGGCPRTSEALAQALCHHGGISEIEESIKLRRRILEFFPVGHPQRNVPLNQLVSSLVCRFGLPGASFNIFSEILGLCKESLDVCFTDSNKDDLALLLNNLGIALARRFIEKHDINDMHSAIAVFRIALTMCPNSDERIHPLILALFTRHFVDDLMEATDLFRQSRLLRGPACPERDAAISTLRSAFCAGLLRGYQDQVQPEPEPELAASGKEIVSLIRFEQSAFDFADAAFSEWIRGTTCN